MSKEPRDPKNKQGRSKSCVTQENSDRKVISLPIEKHFESYLRQWMTGIPEDPTEALLSAKVLIGSSRAQFDKAKLYAAIVGYDAAQKFQASDRLWQAFVRHPSWNDFAGHKPKANTAGEYLRWVMIFAFEAKDDRGKERANVYRGALQAKFDAGAPADSIFDFVEKAGGIDAAYRRSSTDRKALAKEQVTDDDEVSDKSDRSDDDSESDDGDRSESSESWVEDVEDAPRKGDPAEKEERRVQAQILAKIKAVSKKGLVPWIVGVPPELVGGKIQRYAKDGRMTLECKLTSEADDWIDTTCISIQRGKS